MGMSDVADLITLPFRHVVRSVNLWTLNMVFPSAWDGLEFQVGACQAYECIASLMDEGDFQSMHGLVADDVIAELRNDHASCSASIPDVQRSVLECRLAGIYSMSARSDENGDAALVVVALLDTQEAHSSLVEDAPVWHVRRLQKLTFKRVLPQVQGEDP